MTNDETYDTRSLLSMIHKFHSETMDTFSQRNANFDDYDSKYVEMLQNIEAAKKKHFSAAAQLKNIEESKIDLQLKNTIAIKSIRLSDKVIETKSGFFSPKTIVFPSKDRVA